MHTTFEIAPRTPAISSEKLSIYYASLSAMVNPITQQYESRAVRKAYLKPTHTERIGATHPNHLKSEVSITFRCWLCSIHYAAVQIKNCFKNTSAIEVATMKNMDNFCYEGKPSRATTK